MRLLALTALLAALVPSSPSQTVAAPPRYADVRAWLESSVRDGLAPSAAVVVIEDDAIVWAEGFGLADVAQRRPATPETPYSLASISKPLTATGILRLVDAGRLDLDAPVNDYLPGVKLTARAGEASARLRARWIAQKVLPSLGMVEPRPMIFLRASGSVKNTLAHNSRKDSLTCQMDLCFESRWAMLAATGMSVAFSRDRISCTVSSRDS